jgi:hypothetical protein
MLGKIAIFRGKSFEKSFFQEIPRNFPRKVIFRVKKCTKNRPLVKNSASEIYPRMLFSKPATAACQRSFVAGIPRGFGKS